MLVNSAADRYPEGFCVSEDLRQKNAYPPDPLRFPKACAAIACLEYSAV